jgi:hypothetical protein
MTTAALGQLAVVQKLKRPWVQQCCRSERRHKPFITFIALNGKTYKVTTRAKTAGTGKRQPATVLKVLLIIMAASSGYLSILAESPMRSISRHSPGLGNDIHQAHLDYLDKHGGHRAQNDESTHHAISVKRIAGWKDNWEQMGF